MGLFIFYEGIYIFKGFKDKSFYIFKSKSNKWGYNFGIFFNSYDLIFYMKLKFFLKFFFKNRIRDFYI